ncbi:MAG TPA: Hsp20/alpha crystallin family protein [Burkholderiales bacterium]|jgi:HSP20 family protein|nr:Hsp20/alpha crystallin family protein [Burkholderiales bacterium]
MAKEGKEITVSKGKLERIPPARPFGDIARTMDELFGRRWLRPFEWERWERPFAEVAAMPSVDVIDRDDEVVVRAEVPGYKKEDIEVSVSDSLLTIKGETKTEEKEEKGDYYRCEISHGAFSRSIGLPATVDDSKAKASMKDGVLELTLPKLEKSKRHTIAIS